MQKTPQNSVYISYIIRFLKFFTVKKKFQQNSPVICNKFKVFLGVFGILDVDLTREIICQKQTKRFRILLQILISRYLVKLSNASDLN